MPSGADFVNAVESHLGAPGVFGAAGPRQFDCSGLVQYSLGQIGIKAPRTTWEQLTWCTKVQTPSTGNLVFFAGIENDNPPGTPGHVGIVVSPGRMIDCDPSPVQFASFSENGTGVAAFMGYGQVPGLDGSASANSTLLGPGQTGTNAQNEDSFAAVAGGIFFYLVIVVLVVVAVIALGIAAYIGSK